MDQPAGNFLKQEEMRAYVYGSRDARNVVRGKGWFYAGLGVGAAAGYLLETSIFTLAVPPVFALTTRIPVIKIKKKNIADQQYRFNEDYAAGYESYARGKHTIEALKGSAIGAVIGIIAYSIVDNNR
jgi:hypothetical protein